MGLIVELEDKFQLFDDFMLEDLEVVQGVAVSYLLVGLTSRQAYAFL